MKNNDGWIYLHKKMLNWGWYSDNNTKSVFLDFLLTASYEDTIWRGIPIKRGQVITGRDKLSQRLGINVQSLRTAIKRLKSTNEITTKSTNKYTIITVVNYDKYQTTKNELTHKSTNKLTNNQPTTNQQLTTSNKDNKDNTLSSEAEETELAVKYLFKWNEVFGTQYSSTRQITKPLSEWVKDHPLEKILSAIENIKNDPYWKGENLDPIWLLRFKDPKGEPIDRIEKFFNTKPVVKWQTHL